MTFRLAIAAAFAATALALPAGADNEAPVEPSGIPGLLASSPELCDAEAEPGSGEWRVTERGVGSQDVCCPFDARLAGLPEAGVVTVLPAGCTCPDARAVTGDFTLIMKNPSEATLTFSQWEGVIVLQACDAG